jgi:hypothetical protein
MQDFSLALFAGAIVWGVFMCFNLQQAGLWPKDE